jgi:hypothetical protein
MDKTADQLLKEFNASARKDFTQDPMVTHFELLVKHVLDSQEDRQAVAEAMFENIRKTMNDMITRTDYGDYSSQNALNAIQRYLNVIVEPELADIMPRNVTKELATMGVEAALQAQNTPFTATNKFNRESICNFKEILARLALYAADAIKQGPPEEKETIKNFKTISPVKPMKRIQIAKPAA